MILNIKTKDLDKVAEALKSIEVESINIEASPVVMCLLCSLGIIESCDKEESADGKESELSER